MRSIVKAAFFVLACLIAASALEAGGPTALASDSAGGYTGRLELAVLSNGANVSAEYSAVAINMASEHAQQLTLSDRGVLTAELPPGTYFVTVMPSTGSGSASTAPLGGARAAMPTMLTVQIAPRPGVTPRIAHDTYQPRELRP